MGDIGSGERMGGDLAWVTVWGLYKEVKEDPSPQSAMKLVRWLRENPSHPALFEQALRIWAFAGAALVLDQRRNLHPAPDRLQ